MTDQLDELHAQAFLVPLRANLALNVLDGVVPAPFPGPPFVLLYVSVEWPPGEEGIGNSIEGSSVTCRATGVIHCVGATAAACRAMAMQVRASLLDVRPVIPGRECTRITLDDVQPPGKDETTGSVVMDSVVTYSFTSVPG